MGWSTLKIVHKIQIRVRVPFCSTFFRQLRASFLALATPRSPRPAVPWGESFLRRRRSYTVVCAANAENASAPRLHAHAYGVKPCGATNV